MPTITPTPDNHNGFFNFNDGSGNTYNFNPSSQIFNQQNYPNAYNAYNQQYSSGNTNTPVTNDGSNGGNSSSSGGGGGGGNGSVGGPQFPTSGYHLDPNSLSNISEGATRSIQSSSPDPYTPIITPQQATNQRDLYELNAQNPALPNQELFHSQQISDGSQYNLSPATHLDTVDLSTASGSAAQVAAPVVTGRGDYIPQGATAATQYNPATGSQYDPLYAAAATVTPPRGSQYDATQVQGARGQVAQGSQYEAAQGTASQGRVDPMSMIQNQFDAVMSQGLGPDGVPAWARTAVTAARQAMTSMGLGNSTMAGGATAAAILNTALPIATANASVVANLNVQNIQNVQQMELANTAATNAARQFNAGVVAQVNQQNVANAQQAIIANGQWANTAAQYNASITADFAKQTAANIQQANIVNAQFGNDADKYNAAVIAQLSTQSLANQQQTIMSNQAYANAAAQFNSQQTEQHNQFFSSLASTIAAQNADRATSISQFNAGQMNTMLQFNANLNNQRQDFNVQNQLAIDQSNVQWRRAINTANTAEENAANQANVQNLFNMSQTAQNNLWQQARDEASWNLTSEENAQNRTLSLVNSSLNRQTSFQILSSTLNANMFSNLGALGVNLLNGSLGSSVASGIGSIFGGGGGSSSDGGQIDFGGGSDFSS